MGLVKTRRIARHSHRSACSRPYGLRTPAKGGYAMQKQRRAKAGVKPPAKKGGDMLSANRRDNGYGL